MKANHDQSKQAEPECGSTSPEFLTEPSNSGAETAGPSRRAFVGRLAALAAVPFLRPFETEAADEGRQSNNGRALGQILSLSREHVEKVMRRSAARAGLRVETAGMSILTRGELMAVAAATSGLERIPATELVRGIDTGYIYLNGASHLDPGFYRVRVTTRTAHLGENEGVIQLYDQIGNPVWSDPTLLHVASLTLPDRPEGFLARTSIGIHDADPFDPFDPRPCAFRICFLCSNGYGVICLSVAIPTCLIFSS
jgi:hypothetical protein